MLEKELLNHCNTFCQEGMTKEKIKETPLCKFCDIPYLLSLIEQTNNKKK